MKKSTIKTIAAAIVIIAIAVSGVMLLLRDDQHQEVADSFIQALVVRDAQKSYKLMSTGLRNSVGEFDRWQNRVSRLEFEDAEDFTLQEIIEENDDRKIFIYRYTKDATTVQLTIYTGKDRSELIDPGDAPIRITDFSTAEDRGEGL